jgi:hypothetical protein
MSMSSISRAGSGRGETKASASRAVKPARCVLAERVAIVFGHQPVGLVDEQHPTQSRFAHFFHALGGLGDIADDEVLVGDLHDLRALNLGQPEHDFADDAREARCSARSR